MSAASADALYNLFIQGINVRIARYPTQAAGVALTASGKTTGVYKYAAANANSKQIVAKATFANHFKIVGLCLDTFSATGIFTIRLGSTTAAGAAAATWVAESEANEITAAGPVVSMFFPAFVASILADGTNDVVAGDAASSNAGADDTVVASVMIATGLNNP